MIVVCAFAENQERRVPGLRPETRESLIRRCPFPVEFHDVTGDDDGYWRVLCDAWARAYADFTDLWVVEQDIVVRATAFEELCDCPRVWCGYPYEMAGGEGMALGFTRFSRHLIAEQRHLIERAGEMTDDGEPARCWWRLDTRIQLALTLAGIRQHEHRPPLRHLNERQRLVRYA